MCLHRRRSCSACCAVGPCGRVGRRTVCHCGQEDAGLHFCWCVPSLPHGLRYAPDDRSSGHRWVVDRSDLCCVRRAVHRAVADLRRAADDRHLDARCSCARRAVHRAVAVLLTAGADRYLDARRRCALHCPVVQVGWCRVHLVRRCGAHRCPADRRDQRRDVMDLRCARCRAWRSARPRRQDGLNACVDRCQHLVGGRPGGHRARLRGGVCPPGKSVDAQVRSKDAHRAWGLSCRLSCCGQYGLSWVVG